MTVGLSTSLFLKLLDLCLAHTTGYPYYFLFLSVGLLISALVIHYLEPDAKGHGIEKVVEAVYKRGENIHNHFPVKLVAIIITIATARRQGRSGPAVR
jgi:H+/Cl- antiporter ClcA